MANEFLAISDGTFTLSETENKNQFYFYRNDGEVLTDIDSEPIDLYHSYIISKMMNGEITDIVMNDIYSETSDDGKYIRLTICGIGEKQPETTETTETTIQPVSDNKQPNFLKRLLHKIFM